ncbi:MAG TPA: heme utilization protein, partial [Burkholderiaceae bacterium]
RVWVDGNSDGVNQDGELRTLASLNIAKLNLQSNGSTAFDNGNWVGLTSTYEDGNGNTHAAADVWFQTRELGASVSTMSEALSNFSTAAILPATAATRLDVQALSASTGHMAAALGGFDANGQAMATTLTAAPVASSLDITAFNKPADAGFLANGK